MEERTARDQNIKFSNSILKLIAATRRHLKGDTKELLPEIAGVRTPSPITMQAPNKTIRSRAVLDFLCFSRNLFNGEGAIFRFVCPCL